MPAISERVGEIYSVRPQANKFILLAASAKRASGNAVNRPQNINNPYLYISPSPRDAIAPCPVASRYMITASAKGARKTVS